MLGLKALLDLKQAASEYKSKNRIIVLGYPSSNNHMKFISDLENSLIRIQKLEDRIKTLEEELLQEKKNIKTVIRYRKR